MSALLAAVRVLGDRLGLTIGLSATWSLLFLVSVNVAHTLPSGKNPLFMASAALLITLLMAPATAGIHAVVWRILAQEPTDYSDFWRSARQWYGLSLQLGLLNVAICGILSFSLWFYAHWRTTAGIAAAFLSFDALVLWGSMAIYHFPLLIAQETGVFDTPEHRARRGLRAILRRAFFLTIGKPGHAFGLLFSLLLLSVLLVPILGLNFILWPGLIAFAATAGTRNLLLQFTVLSPPETEEVLPDEKFRMRLDK